jgi:RimJ/RimL family protein N-acetyltransferase
MPAPITFDDRLLDEDCLTAEAHLRLRRLRPTDVEALARGLNDLDVAKNLVAVPHPYGVADAEEFLAGTAAAPHSLCAAIEVDGAFAGCVALDGSSGMADLGYWVARPFWGRGIATTAARALLDLAFATQAIDIVSSGHFLDNDASAAVLAKLGFRRYGIVETHSRARAETVRLVAMRLTREGWAETQPAIETPRLVMRPPVAADADAIALLAATPGSALMTASVPLPTSRGDARAFILATARQRRPSSLSFAMRLKESGALVGGVGWKMAEPDVVDLGYWLSADHRGLGLATEAARAVLEAAFAMTGAKAAKAHCRVTNASSRGVLERCAFQWEGTGLIRLAPVGGAVAVDRFRLERDVFQSLRAWAPAAFRNACA